MKTEFSIWLPDISQFDYEHAVVVTELTEGLAVNKAMEILRDYPSVWEFIQCAGCRVRVGAKDGPPYYFVEFWLTIKWEPVPHLSTEIPKHRLEYEG